eukprot:scaffold2368_cov72-Phaeocystis_antarctica.AAC.1
MSLPNGLAPAGLRVELRGHPHVDDAQVAVLVYEHVGRLQVAVEHLLLVHVTERQRELRDHEAHPFLLDGLAVVRHEVLGHGVAGHVLLHHVQVLRRLEAIDHPHDVGVVALDEALALARAVQPPPPRALRSPSCAPAAPGRGWVKGGVRVAVGVSSAPCPRTPRQGSAAACTRRRWRPVA